MATYEFTLDAGYVAAFHVCLEFDVVDETGAPTGSTTEACYQYDYRNLTCGFSNDGVDCDSGMVTDDECCEFDW